MDYDFAVVGSGFGGSVAALRLVEKGYRVVVLERGREFSQAEFAESNWTLPRYLWMPRLGLFGPQELSLPGRLLALTGSGVGGGSLVYGGVLEQPRNSFFDNGDWSKLTDWRKELAPHYETARRMLGAAPVPSEAGFDRALERLQARGLGRYRKPEVGIYFGDATKREGFDPYFDGAGPQRSACNLCGGCMVGCRYGAKNTLDKNYLHLARSRGAELLDNTLVTRVRPVDDAQGESGYELTLAKPGALLRSRKRSLSARGVVLAAGTLGTNRLLLNSKRQGALPNLSPKLGEFVRSNNEEFLFVRTKDTSHHDAGVAVQSVFEPDAHTTILMGGFAPGSSLMGTLVAPHRDQGKKHPGVLGGLLRMLGHPGVALRTYWLRRWAESTRALVIMQDHDSEPARFTAPGGRLRMARDPRLPTFIEAGHAVGRELAGELSATVQPFLTNAFFRIPVTAHVFGGAVMGATPERGVVDASHQVFGYRNFYVCDGSTLAANVGTAPSLTIAAMAERAMSRLSPL